MTTNNNVFETTAVRNVIRGAVSSLVGALVAWGTTKWASISNGNLAYLVPAFSTAYFAAIHFLEKKYPKFGWLLGVLPKANQVLIVPTVEPTPVAPAAPAKAAAPAKKAAAVKKTAPKKNEK